VDGFEVVGVPRDGESDARWRLQKNDICHCPRKTR
jgi:hypothetical protein